MINGKDLLSYMEGDLITTDTPFDYTSVTTDAGEYTFTFDHLERFNSDNWTYLQKLQYQWFRSKELPRKKKKAYRKRLLIEELREYYRQFLMQKYEDRRT